MVFQVRCFRDAFLIGSKGCCFNAASTKSKLHVGTKDLVTPLVSFKPQTHFLMVLSALNGCPWTGACLSEIAVTYPNTVIRWTDFGFSRKKSKTWPTVA